MRKAYETNSIESEFEFAKQDVYDLQEEMSASADNMPEQLGTAHAEAARLLDTAWSFLLDCDVPSDLRDKEVVWQEWKGNIHRPQRRDNVVNFLYAYLSQIRAVYQTAKLREDLRFAIDILSDVYFPGMRGKRAA